eukprot:TRINITY_DN7190_c2_g1_i1.p1 TRINITY_DN7190_c2_g1~~TRINITY_DN7190_c2_g1_i1.p1  ORF type:complete len:1478 (+),score=501.53 TRINITY_DN7190_c2_g1_i1:46-4434(+)
MAAAAVVACVTAVRTSLPPLQSVSAVLSLHVDGSAEVVDFGSAGPIAAPPQLTGTCAAQLPPHQLRVAEAALVLDDWLLDCGSGDAPSPREWELRCSLGGPSLLQRFADPRRVVEEGPSGKNGHMHGAVRLRKAVWPLRFPAGACDELLVAAPGREPIRVRLAAPRRPDLLQSGISHTTPQRVGPVDVVANLVLVSGGYLSSQQDKFNTDVDNVVRLFRQPPGQFSLSVPFARYFDTFNVFAVFQPSTQEGASRNGVTVSDNLKCEYGQTNPNALFCDTALMMALGDTSPAKPSTNLQNSVVIALVNSPHYGGGGMYSKKFRGGAFFNGFTLTSDSNKTRFASLLFHELGHSWSDLLDEYDMLITEPQDLAVANCLSPQDKGAGRVPWQAWIDKWAANPVVSQEEVDTVAAMKTPCGYTNYFRPSSSSTNPCLMERLTGPRMCPVCREKVTLKIFEHSSGSSLLWPSCPLPDDIVYVEKTRTDPLWLFANHRLAAKGEVKITWKVGTTELCSGTGTACSLTSLTASQLSDGANTVTLTVEDQTSWVLTANRRAEMLQSHTITVNLVSAISTVDNSTGNLTRRQCYCETAGAGCRDNTFFVNPPTADTGYYTECKAGGQCDLDFSSTEYEQPTEIGEDLAQYDSYVLYLGAGFGVSALGLWLGMWRKYRNRTGDNRVNAIFKVKWKKKFMLVRVAMMVTAVCIMIASLGTLVVALWLYTKLSGLAKYILIPGGVIALLLYLMAFLGFWSTWLRSTCLLIANGITLLLCCGACAVVAYYADWFKESVGSQDHSAAEFLKDTWEYFVKERPADTCQIQDLLDCSGYEESCRRVPSTLQCPADCEVTNNKYADACRKRIDGFIEDYFPKVYLYALLLGIALFIGVLFNFSLIFALRGMRKEAEEQKKQRLQRIQRKMSAPLKDGSGRPDAKQEDARAYPSIYLLQDLDGDERDRLARQFEKWNVRQDGMLDKSDWPAFCKKALGHKPTAEETDELFRCGDPDGTGRVNFCDMLAALSGGAWSPAPGVGLGPKKKSFAAASVSRKDSEASLLQHNRRESVAKLFTDRHGMIREDNRAAPDDADSVGVAVLPRTLSDGTPLLPLTVHGAGASDSGCRRPDKLLSPADFGTPLFSQGSVPPSPPPEYKDDVQLTDVERTRRARLREAWQHGQQRGMHESMASAPAWRTLSQTLQQEEDAAAGLAAGSIAHRPARFPRAQSLPPPPDEYRDSLKLAQAERSRRSMLRSAFAHGQRNGLSGSGLTVSFAESPRLRPPVPPSRRRPERSRSGRSTPDPSDRIPVRHVVMPRGGPIGVEYDEGGAQDGVLVARVVPGSPADVAGISAGEVIVAVAGRPVTSEQSLGAAVAEAQRAGAPFAIDTSSRHDSITRGQAPSFAAAPHVHRANGSFPPPPPPPPQVSVWASEASRVALAFVAAGIGLSADEQQSRPSRRWAGGRPDSYYRPTSLDIEL